MNHIIVSRVNLRMRLDPYKYDNTELWKTPGWDEQRVQLLNDWARASLRKQTCQDFTFVSLWWDGKIYAGGELDNELRLTISETCTEDDEPLNYRALTKNKPGKLTLNFSDQIREKIAEHFDPPLLVTNLDCDDALHYKFVETLQSREFAERRYYSSTDRYCYNVNTGARGVKRSHAPSPFVSTYEPEIECLPLTYNHSYLHKWVPGDNIEGLVGLQSVNSTNMFSRSTGETADFDLSEYV